MTKKSKKEVPVILSSTENVKPYTEEAHEFLKILGRWVWLRSTNPSAYNDYHEVTRKWLEKFKAQ